MKTPRNTRMLAVAAVLALVPFAAAAQTYTANLSPANVVPNPGPDGASGFATIVIEGTSISYNLLFSGVDSPTAAHIHEGAAGASGGVVVDLAPGFTGGFAAGSVAADPDVIDGILGDPSGYYVQIHSAEFPNGALRGQLGTTSGGAGVTLYIPVIATVAGQAGTDFHTDARIVNRSGAAANVTLGYFPRGAGGASGPAQTADIEIASNEQAVLDDVATELFGVTNGAGALEIVSDQAVSASARIYNDQRAAGAGTFGQFVQALGMSDALTSGTIAFLSNEDPATGAGYRTNIGWFNPNGTSVDVVLRGWDTSGTYLGEVEHTAGAYEQLQRSLGQLWPALSTYGNLYVTFTADAPVFFYGSVVDNVNGDAIYVPATD